MERQTSSIISIAILTMVILLTVDVYKIVSIPFTGMWHWIPELICIFLLSNYSAKNFLKRIRWSIFAATLAFPILWYQSVTGIFAAVVFSTAMLLGFLFEDLKEVKE